MKLKSVAISLGVIFLLIGAGFAQDLKSEVNVQGIAVITKSTNDILSPSSATRSGGFLAGYRYHLLPWFAVQGDYAFTRNTQNFFDPLNLGGPGIQTNIHELTGEAVLTAGSHHRVRPYAMAGAGGLFFRPTNNATNNILGGITNSLGLGGGSQSRMAFVYGGGVDINLTRFMALRGEYRGLLFHAPGLEIPGLSLIGLGSPSFTHMAQPSVGLVWRF